MNKTIEYLDSEKLKYTISDSGLITIHGDFYAYGEVDLEGVEAITGSVDVCENARLTANALTSIGNYVCLYQNARLTANSLTDVNEVCFNTKLFGYDVIVIDGIGCVKHSEKTKNGVKIMRCQRATFKNRKLVGDKFYIASLGENNAHGESISIALQELAFKEDSRNVEQFRNMPLDAKKRPGEWALIYRMITGACQYGTKSFMESKGKLKKYYTLEEILAQTASAYGYEKFRQVVRGMRY